MSGFILHNINVDAIVFFILYYSLLLSPLLDLWQCSHCPVSAQPPGQWYLPDSEHWLWCGADDRCLHGRGSDWSTHEPCCDVGHGTTREDFYAHGTFKCGSILAGIAGCK